MELTKQENQMAKGVAILAMVMLHLFCRLGDLPYTPLIWIGHTPLIYYLVLFPDLVFAAKYPLLVLAWMLLLSVVTSYLINWIYQPIASKVLCAAQHRFENFTRTHRRP